MRVLIIEDEPPVAREIEYLARSILGAAINSVDIVYTFNRAKRYMEKNAIDLCLLDLNLDGADGFDLLKQTVANNFHTIIISAYTESAIKAYNYGVLDFVPKPVDKDRLQIAFDRFLGKIETEGSKAKYLIVKKGYNHKIVNIGDILFFKAEGYLVDLYLKNGSKEIIEKPLNFLEQILPKNFIRTHRSYIVDFNQIDYFKHKSGSTYDIYLKNKLILPLSYSNYKRLKNLLKTNIVN